MGLSTDVIIAIVVFLTAYGLIISEKLHRTVISLGGAVLVIILGVLSQEEAVHGVDFNTLGLLMGMMIVVGITRRTGVFEFISIKAAKVSKGDPVKILVLLTIITALLSAFLDNVTTVLLIVPVSFSICDRLNVPVLPYLLCEVIGSNIGGTATLIGDPPNILIGSATHLGFNDFIINLGPVIIIILAVTVGLMVLMYREKLEVTEENKLKIMEINEFEAIKDRLLLKKSLVVLAIVILGFFLHQLLGLESATIALFGAVLLMIVAREEPEDVLLTVEWPTLFFFVGLFIMVEALVKTGVIEYIAKESLRVTQGNFPLTTVLVLWLSGIASAFVDNIPFVTAMIPLLESIGQMTGMPMDPLWWSLSLGACLGGNGTLIGASANVVTAGISEKNGQPISFMTFTKVGFPLMIVSLIIATIYIYMRFIV